MNDILRADRYYGFTRLLSIMGLIALFCMFEENFNWENIKYLNMLLPNKGDMEKFLLFNLLFFGRAVFFFHIRKIYILISGELLSSYLIYIYSSNYFISLILSCQSLILALKQYSFYYDQYDEPERKISFFKYLRFLFLPILIYSESNIQTQFNLNRFITYLLLTILSLTIFTFLFIFYLIPLLLNLNIIKLNRSIEYAHFVFFSIITWLALFYCFFVNYLRMIGILFCYDVETYKNWWNSKNIKEFWRLWNVQTYRYIKKYIKFSNSRLHRLRNLLIFILSASFHEYISILIFKRILGIAFFSMLIQMGLFYIEDLMPISSGNSFFWISNIIIGQPICLLFFNIFLNKI